MLPYNFWSLYKDVTLLLHPVETLMLDCAVLTVNWSFNAWPMVRPLLVKNLLQLLGNLTLHPQNSYSIQSK